MKLVRDAMLAKASENVIITADTSSGRREGASHNNGLVSKPTIILDGKILEENGVYKEEKSIEFCKALGIAGY